MKKIILSLITLIFTSSLLYAQTFPGEKKWRTIETPHFRIHFPDELKLYASRLSHITEEYFEVLTRSQKWEPAGKTDVILIDVTDMSNGYSTPFPQNKVVMYLSRPQPHDLIGNFDDWLTTLFIHEYTHTLNMDQVNGIPACGRALCGKIIVPNVLQPIFLIEGNAVLNESKLTGEGRLNSNYTEMIMRTEFNDGNEKSLSLASNYPYEWPAGNIPYLYGAYFNLYLVEKRGKSFAEVFTANSNNVLPFMNFMNSYDVYKTSFPGLYEEWRKAMYRRYDKQREKIREIPLTPVIKITDRGYINSLPVFSDDGTSVYYVSDDGKSSTAIYSTDVVSKKTVKIKNVVSPQSMTMDDGSVLYNDPRIYSNKYIFYDLFEITKDGKRRRLTKKGRVLYADRKGGILSVISYSGDLYSLEVMDSEHTLFVLENSPVQMFYCRISPDRNKLLFGYRKHDGNTSLAVADIQTGKVTTVCDDSSDKLHPSWLSNDRILFSSDKSGVYNLYELDLGKKRLSRLTNTETGFFESSASPDGKKIAAVNYSINGYDIVLVDYPENAVTSELLTFSPLSMEYFQDISEGDAYQHGSKNYSAFSHLMPSIWVPVYWGQVYGDTVYNSFQLYLLAQDPLEFHSYQFSGGYVPELNNAFVDVDYVYSRFVPKVSLLYMNDNLFLSDNIDWTYDDEKTDTVSLSSNTALQLAFPFIKTSYSGSFSLYGIYTQKSEYILYPDETYSEEKSTESYMGMNMVFSNTSYFPYSVTGEKGIDLSVDGIFSDERINSDSENVILVAASSISLPSFFRNHVLRLSASGGTVFGRDKDDNLFSLGSSYFRSRNFESVSAMGMRGYESSEAEGCNFVETSFSYYLPLVRREGGCGTAPFMFRKMYVSPYFSAGDVFDRGSDFSPDNLKKTVGVELYADFSTAYFLVLSFYGGYSHGMDNEGQDSWYFGIQGLIEGRTSGKIMVK